VTKNDRGSAYSGCRVAGPPAIVGCAQTECSRRGFRTNTESHGFAGHEGLFAGERRFPHCRTHACRRAQTPPCLSHRPHRDVHGDASEPVDRARVSSDRAAVARCRELAHSMFMLIYVNIYTYILRVPSAARPGPRLKKMLLSSLHSQSNLET